MDRLILFLQKRTAFTALVFDLDLLRCRSYFSIGRFNS